KPSTGCPPTNCRRGRKTKWVVRVPDTGVAHGPRTPPGGTPAPPRAPPGAGTRFIRTPFFLSPCRVQPAFRGAARADARPRPAGLRAPDRRRTGSLHFELPPQGPCLCRQQFRNDLSFCLSEVLLRDPARVLPGQEGAEFGARPEAV